MAQWGLMYGRIRVMFSKKKRVVIVHGWASSPKDCWFPWLSGKLARQGIEVIIPAMPSPKKPNIKRWIAKLAKSIPNPDVNTFFVGHSLGCYIILKFLEEYAEKKVGGVVCVGGRLGKEGRPLVSGEIVRHIAPRIRAIFSDDDYYIPLSEAERFHRELGAEVSIEHNRGHFSHKEGITELPEVLDALSRMIRGI